MWVKVPKPKPVRKKRGRKSFQWLSFARGQDTLEHINDLINWGYAVNKSDAIRQAIEFWHNYKKETKERTV